MCTLIFFLFFTIYYYFTFFFFLLLIILSIETPIIYFGLQVLLASVGLIILAVDEMTSDSSHCCLKLSKLCVVEAIPSLDETAAVRDTSCAYACQHIYIICIYMYIFIMEIRISVNLIIDKLCCAAR